MDRYIDRFLFLFLLVAGAAYLITYGILRSTLLPFTFIYIDSAYLKHLSIYSL